MCPLSCGFGKVLALETSRQVADFMRKNDGENPREYRSRLLHEQYNKFNESFRVVHDNFKVNFKTFIKKLPILRETVKKWNFRKSEEKKKFLSTFSSANWEKLSENRKKEHTFESCRACALRHADVQALFPVKSKLLKAKAKQNPVFTADQEVESLRRKNTHHVKPTHKEIVNAAKHIVDKLTPVFESTYNKNFAEALSKVPGLDLQHKTTLQRRQNRRNNYKRCKENAQNQMEETSFLR